MTTPHNILVVSDLHLGEDLNPSAAPTTRKQITQVEQNLLQFLRHYAQRRENGRPWRLVINGDMFDFMSVVIAPEDGEKVSRDERIHGLSRRPKVAVRQLAMVAERHWEVFRALARFIGRGNRVEIIAGNHDTEMQFPPVQRAFSENIARAWGELAESRRRGAMSAEDLVDRIEFHRWFYHEPGRVWIEHGHQYDECCSYEYQLYPRAAGSSDIMLNVDTAGCRYITNVITDADPHQQEEWSALGYLQLGWSIGLRKGVKLAIAYATFAIKLLLAWRRYAQAVRDRRRAAEVHRRRLNQLAASRGLSKRTLMSIDNLRRRPVVRHLRRLSAVVMADKVLFYGLALVATLASLALLPLPYKAIAPVLAVGGAHLITRWTGRNRIIDPAMGLELISERIAKQLDVKAVAFGHTHQPVSKSLQGGARYLNSGTWVPTARPGLLGVFTHLIIRLTDDGVDGGLYRWSAGASHPITVDQEVAEPERTGRELAPAAPAAEVA